MKLADVLHSFGIELMSSASAAEYLGISRQRLEQIREAGLVDGVETIMCSRRGGRPDRNGWVYSMASVEKRKADVEARKHIPWRGGEHFMDTNTAWCNGCEEVLPLTSFGKGTKPPFNAKGEGRQSYCKPCQNEANAESKRRRAS